MYVTNSRGSDNITFKGGYYRVSTLNEYNFSFPRVVEGVYSWRTGSGHVSEPVENNNSDDFGITKPVRNKNLLETLGSRRRYLENLDRTVGEIFRKNSTTSYTSRTDNGHEFTKFFSRKDPLWVSGTAIYLSRENTRVSSHGWYNFSGYTSMPNFSTRSFPFKTTSVSKMVTGTNLRGIQNGVYSSANPNRGGTTLLITVLELLRGDIPSVVKNLRRNILNAKRGEAKYLKEIGDDYLNIQFGWVPILNEIENVIKLLLKIDSLVYGGDAYRRHRRVQGPVVTKEWEKKDASLSALNTPFNAGTAFTTGKTGGGSGSALARCDCHMTAITSENYAFSAKFSGIARPKRRHDEFLRRAEYVLNQLGGDSPARVLWELTSWSWLIDWFATIGDSITNATTYSPISGKYAQDYAYWTTITRYYVQGKPSNVRPWGNNTINSVHPGSYIIEVKDRERITPFGFGTSFGNLTTYQWSILVALGLAKAA